MRSQTLATLGLLVVLGRPVIAEPTPTPTPDGDVIDCCTDGESSCQNVAANQPCIDGFTRVANSECLPGSSGVCTTPVPTITPTSTPVPERVCVECTNIENNGHAACTDKDITLEFCEGLPPEWGCTCHVNLYCNADTAHCQVDPPPTPTQAPINCGLVPYCVMVTPTP